MSCMAILGSELAWESMATADWVRICWRTNSVISVATSTSEIWDSAAWDEYLAGQESGYADTAEEVLPPFPF